MRAIIKSSVNPKVKQAISLHQRKNRETEGLFLAEGVRLVEMAAASGWEIVHGFYTMEAAKDERGAALLAELEKRCMMYEVPLPLFSRISDTQTPQGIMLVMKIQENPVDTESLFRRKQPLLLILDGVQDPGNAGTILRTADAAGLDGVILMEGSVDAFSAKTVRASMGSIFHVPVISHVTNEELMNAIEEWGIPLFAADVDDTAKPYFRQDFREAAAIIFGNEANGISGELLAVSKKLYIPMQGHAESLNVAVSASVIAYEALRQRSM